MTETLSQMKYKLQRQNHINAVKEAMQTCNCSIISTCEKCEVEKAKEL